MLDRARLRLRSIVLHRRLEREMQEEMADHIERSVARLMARGLSAAEARREAHREFGNVAWLQEQARDARGARWVDALAADARFALRQFARRPGTTLTMFVVLAAGMCIATLLFSFVHSYAMQPPPGIPRDDDLVRVRGSRDDGEGGRMYRTFPEEELLAYRGLAGPFRAVAGWTDAAMPVAAAGDAERRSVEAVVTFATEDYFGVLGVRPALGPGLPTAPSDDPGAAAVAVIGHAAWDQLFGRSPGPVGSTLLVNRVPVTVVGVAPERFGGVGLAFNRVRVWMPLAARRLVMPGPSGEFRAAARLRPGVGHAEATAAVRVVAARFAASRPAAGARNAAAGEETAVADPTTDVVPLLAANGDPMFERDVKLMSFLVGLLGLLVLMVACTNVAALQTGLATARRQEIAVRLSLGAARARIVRQLLTESALLATAAAAAALGAVWLVLRLAARLVPGMPFTMEVTPQATAFTFGTALAVGVAFGLSPALHGTRLAIAGALRDSTAGVAAARGRLQRGLVVAQIAFTQPLIVLLAAVLLIVLGEIQLQRRTALADRLVTVSLRPATPLSGSAPAAGSREELRAATRRLGDRLRDMPGVEAAVADAGGPPQHGVYEVHPHDRVAGGVPGAVRLSGRRVGGGYFGVNGIPVVRGREFTPTEASPAGPGHAEVPVVVGADLARRLWGGADPVGRRVRAAGDSVAGPRTLVVVGVVDDPPAGARGAGEGFRVYLPPDTGYVSGTVLVRTAGPAQTLLPALRAAAQEEAGRMAADVRTVAEAEDEARRSLELAVTGVSAAGLMALLLSAIGLYAVVAFSVGQRTREIAVRIAVGAGARQIVRRFVADGLRLSAAGLALGLPFGLAGLHLLLSADADFPRVPLGRVTVLAALGVGLVATAAAWIPARRAAAVDPAVTLRGG